MKSYSNTFDVPILLIYIYNYNVQVKQLNNFYKK